MKNKEKDFVFYAAVVLVGYYVWITYVVPRVEERMM